MELNKLECDRLTVPRRPPYEAVGDYQVSKLLTKKFPRWMGGNDVISGNVAVSLSIAQRKLHQTEVRLKAKRQYEMEQIKVLDKKWEELERKERELRDSFVQFNEFVKENEHKRDRAVNQMEQHKALERERTGKVYEMMEQYRQLKEVKKLIDEKIDEFKIYEDFLHKVVESNHEEFKDILDVIKRYETLTHAKKILAEKQEHDIDSIQKEKTELRHMSEAYRERIQLMHTKLSVIVKRHEIARFRCLKWEKMMETVQEQVAEKIQEVYEVRTTCANLYEEVCERMHHEPIYRDNIEMQLYCIRKGLRDLDMVNSRIRKMQEKETFASEQTLASGSSR